jgi:hypothetical protein
MPNQKTVVEYDVTQPEEALKRLRKAIGDVEKTAGKGFGEARKASQSFESGLRLVNPRAAELLTNVTRLTTGGFLPMVAATGAVAVGVGAVVAALIDVPDATQRSEDRLKSFIGVLGDLNNAAQAVRGIEFAADSSRFEETLRQLRRTQGRLRGDQARIKEEQAALQESLVNQRAYYNELNKLAEESTSRREGLENRLRGIQERAFFSNIDTLPLGQQISQLEEAIKGATDAGNFDAVERLLSKLQQVAQQSGNAFAKNTANKAQEEYVKNLNEAVKAARQEEQINVRNAQLSEQRVTGIQKEIAEREKADKQITNDIAVLRDLLAQVQADFDDAFDLNSANKAAIEFRNHLRAIHELAGDNFTGLDEAIAALKSLPQAGLNLFGGKAGDIDFDEQNKQIEDLLNSIRHAATQVKGGSAADAKRAAQEAQEVLDKLAGVRLEGEFSSGFDVFIKRIEDTAKQITQAGKSASEFVGAGRSPLSQIKEESERTVQPFQEISNILNQLNAKSKIFETNLKGAADQANTIQQLNNVNLPGSAAPTARQPGASAVPVAPTGVGGNVSISVNANVRGGIIDNETASSIVDIVNRGIRQGIIQIRQQ